MQRHTYSLLSTVTTAQRSSPTVIKRERERRVQDRTEAEYACNKPAVLNSHITLPGHSVAAQPTNMTNTSSNQLFSALEAYPWSTDFEYQSGLAAILGQPSLVSSENPQSIPATSHNRDLHLRARCFFYARKYPDRCGPQGIDFSTYAAWRFQQPEYALSPLELTNPPATPASAPSSEDNTPEKLKPSMDIGLIPEWQQSTLASAPAPAAVASSPPSGAPSTSFAEIKQLIQEGKPIPGIQEVPKTVLEGQGSESRMPRRKKPWEKHGPLDAEAFSPVRSHRPADLPRGENVGLEHLLGGKTDAVGSMQGTTN